MDISAIATLVTGAGLGAALSVFFVWQSSKREDSFNVRITELDKFQKEILIKMVKENTEVLTRNQDVLERNQDVFQRCIDIMQSFEKHLEASRSR